MTKPLPIVDDSACEHHACGHAATEPHTCPYGEEIHDDYETLCTCCDDCAHECAMDI